MPNTLLPSGAVEESQIQVESWLRLIVPLSNGVSVQAKYFPDSQGMRSEKKASLAIPTQWRDNPMVLATVKKFFNIYVVETTGNKVELDMTKPPDKKSDNYLIWTGRIGPPTPRVNVEGAEEGFYEGHKLNLVQALALIQEIIREGIQEGTSGQTNALINALETIGNKLDDSDSRALDEKLNQTLKELTTKLESISFNEKEGKILEAIQKLQEQIQQSENQSGRSGLDTYIALSQRIYTTPIVHKDALIIYKEAFNTIIKILKENELHTLSISIKVLDTHIQAFQEDQTPKGAKELHESLTTLEEELSIYDDKTVSPTWQTSPNIRLEKIFAIIQNEIAGKIS